MACHRKSARFVLILLIASRTDGLIYGLALACPENESKSIIKFSKIPPSGLGGDSVTDRWTDAGRKNIVALTRPYYKGKSCSRVKFRRVG